MKKVIYILSLCIVTLVITGCSTDTKSSLNNTNYEEKISKLEKRIEELEKNISDECKEISNEDENNITNRLDKLEEEIQRKQDKTKVKDYSKEIQTINDKLSNISTNDLHIVKFISDSYIRVLDHRHDSTSLLTTRYHGMYTLIVKDGDKISNYLPYYYESFKENTIVSSKNGFKFEGWYTEKDGKGEKISLDSVVNKNLDLYAYFEPLAGN